MKKYWIDSREVTKEEAEQVKRQNDQYMAQAEALNLRERGAVEKMFAHMDKCKPIFITE